MRIVQFLRHMPQAEDEAVERNGTEVRQSGREQLELAAANMHIRLEVALCPNSSIDRTTLAQCPSWPSMIRA